MATSIIQNSARSSKPNNENALEIAHKLDVMRTALNETGAAAVRLRGTDWFSWATAGATHTVLLAAESGVAEVLVTAEDAWLMTNEIEAQRFKDEELPIGGDRGSYRLSVHPWISPEEQDAFILEVTGGGLVISDKPSSSVQNSSHNQSTHDQSIHDQSTGTDFVSHEAPLPPSLLRQKRIMMSSELERYRQVGRLASEAMTEVLFNAKPTWTEYQLAGAGAEALWARGLHPALTLAAGERRLPLYRHPIPTEDPIGRVAMLVFCARGYGLYANLTRFVCFGSLSGEEANLHQQVREVEAATLNACKSGVALSEVYGAIARSYEQVGHPHAIREHHQGGTTGYLSREVIATPTTTDTLAANMAMAWNPSLPGAKIEDTFVLLDDGSLENLTFDPNWQSAEIEGRLRPLPLER